MTWPLDARHLAEWWEEYDRAKKAYVGGFIGGLIAADALRKLRYRDDALKVELKEWEKARRERQDVEYALRQRSRNVLKIAEQTDKERNNGARGITPSSS